MSFTQFREDDNRQVSVRSGSDKDSVLVVSQYASDADLVSSLLQDTIYRSIWLKDTAPLSSGENNTLKSEQSVAAIVCHRKFNKCQPLPLADKFPDHRIIVLSDCEAEQTVVTALNDGAHCFINMCEPKLVLQARLEAALRTSQDDIYRSLSVGNIHFDAQKRMVTLAGQAVNLSPKEFDFAFYLFSNRHRVICNEELMTSIWSLPSTMDTRRIDTVRSIGYRLIQCSADEVCADVCNKGFESCSNQEQDSSRN